MYEIGRSVDPCFYWSNKPEQKQVVEEEVKSCRREPSKLKKVSYWCGLGISVAVSLFLCVQKFLTDDFDYLIVRQGKTIECSEKLCEVRLIEDDEVIVETSAGDLYAFYGDGYEVGENILCFFEDGEIVDVQ